MWLLLWAGLAWAEPNSIEGLEVLQCHTVAEKLEVGGYEWRTIKGFWLRGGVVACEVELVKQERTVTIKGTLINGVFTVLDTDQEWQV